MAARTPLYDWHVRRNAKIVDFGGWDMPIIYTSIVEEHNATRTAAGTFDISHMGRLRFDGPQAADFLDHVLTNRVATLKPGQIRYSLALNDSGCTLDDVLVYRMETHHMLVVNASNRLKLLPWFVAHMQKFNVRMTDLTADCGMIAIQGPLAIGLVEEYAGQKFGHLKYYFGMETKIDGVDAVVSRTGYTGEDGLELIVPAKRVEAVWTALLDAGKDRGVLPIALGARDTLRLEAAMPLYGHELNEQTDPIQAGLGWAVKIDEKDFVGKSALQNRDPDRPVRVGIQMNDRRIPREGYAISANGNRVGTITSGTFGPTLQASIGMGYLSPELSTVDTEIGVVIRDTPAPAKVVSMPFYQRKKS